MSKKLCFLMSFVLLLGLSGTVQAATDINVVNHSFEYDINGVQITEQIWTGDLQGWTMRDTTGWGGGWQFVDDEWGVTGYEAADGNVCSFNVTADEPDDPNASCQIIQILGDPNAVIAENHRYTLTFNALRLDIEETPTVYGALFYSLGGVNVPPANDVTLASKEPVLTSPPWGAPGYVGWEEITLTYTALSGADSNGETLGVKLSVPVHDPWLDGYQVVMDNVRVESRWATDAWDPDPADGAEDVPIDVNLAWSPGLWAVNDVNGHEVYFGTSYAEVYDANTATAGIYRGSGVGVVSGPDVNNRYSYDIPEVPELGKTYYWRIDEVNEDYAGPPAAAPDASGRWKGEVWSFRTTGLAYNVYPADWAKNIPALNLLLRWTAGTDANGHDVYFGSDEAAVEDANTNTAGIYRGPTQPLADVNYLVEDLDVSKTYFWRIDEVNTTSGTLVQGDVWRFTTGVFLLVDSFEWYADKDAIRAVWKDSSTGTIPKNLAEIFLESADANKFLDTGEQSMRFYYRNRTATGPNPDGSTAEANLPLEVGTNWTVGGVKALVVNFCGDTDNGKEDHASYSLANDRLWMSLLDGSSNEGIMRYSDMNHVTDGAWHTWDISLLDPNFSGVDMNNVAKLYIGFGGVKGGAPSKHGAGYADMIGDTVWFDDIKLYPPRCIVEYIGVDYLHDLGDFDSDCLIGFSDLDAMARDWNMRGQWVTAAPPAEPPEVWYRFDDGPGKTVVKNDGSWSGYDISIHSPNAVDEPNWTTDAAPALDPCDPNYALDFDGLDDIAKGDWLSIPNSAPSQFAGTENMSITVWIKPNGTPIPFDSIIESRNNSGETTKATGLGIGEWDSTVMYWWNNNYWNWYSGLTVDADVWSFIAVTVEPTKAVVYLSDGSTLTPATNTATHEVLVDWDPNYMNLIAVNASNYDPANWMHFNGKIDDVRLYNKTLSIGEIMGLAGVQGMAYVPLNSNVDLVVGDKDPCYPNVDDQIDFRDYAILAEHWLEQHLWP